MNAIVTAPTLSDLPHGFFEGRFDAQEAARRLMPGGRIARLKQVHSARAVLTDRDWPDDARPEADAMATATPGLLLAIVTADCVPVLLADKKAGVVGAAHAGWRGALDGVGDAVIGAMLSLGARIDRITAAIGPAIAQKNYEVGPDFPDRFLDEDADNARFFTEGPSGRPHFDLVGYVAARLSAAGLARVWMSGEDTYAQPDRFPSYRRATHQGSDTDIRLFSMIGMAPNEG